MAFPCVWQKTATAPPPTSLITFDIFRTHPCPLGKKGNAGMTFIAHWLEELAWEGEGVAL